MTHSKTPSPAEEIDEYSCCIMAKWSKCNVNQNEQSLSGVDVSDKYAFQGYKRALIAQENKRIYITAEVRGSKFFVI